MTFEQMTAFEVKSKVCIFFYFMVHCVINDTDVPLGGLGNSSGALRRLLLHITESGEQINIFSMNRCSRTDYSGVLKRV